MEDDGGLRERIFEAARLLGSDEVNLCPDERVCSAQDTPEYTGDPCVDCWIQYILVGE